MESPPNTEQHPEYIMLADSQVEHDEILLNIHQEIQNYASQRRKPEITIRTLQGIWAQMLYAQRPCPCFDILNNCSSEQDVYNIDLTLIEIYRKEATFLQQEINRKRSEEHEALWEAKNAIGETRNQISEEEMRFLWEGES